MSGLLSGNGGAATAAMQNELNQAQNTNNQISGNAGTLLNQASQYYDSSLAGASGLINSNLSAISPSYTANLGNFLQTGGNTSGATGVNQNALGQQFVNYASNPSATNLSQANPTLNSFYTGEMQNGLNPQYAQNQQNQIQQNLQTSLNTAKAQAAPGQNVNALTKDLTNSALASSANLGGQLALENQQTQAAGAQGLASTASNLDAQQMNMLQSALTQGLGLNTQTAQNMLSALGLGQQSLTNATGFAQQGTSNINDANSALSGVASSQNQLAQYFGNQAAQAQSSGGLLGGLLGSIGNMATGGLSGLVSGGISNLFSGGGSFGSNSADMGTTNGLFNSIGLDGV